MENEVTLKRNFMWLLNGDGLWRSYDLLKKINVGFQSDVRMMYVSKSDSCITCLCQL